MSVLERVLEVRDVLDRRVSYVLVEDADGRYAVVIRPPRGVWECTVHPSPDGYAADCEHAKAAAEFVNPPETGSRFAPGAKPLDAGAYCD